MPCHSSLDADHAIGYFGDDGFLPILLRGSLTLLSLLPLGLAMGIPFATGIRYLSAGQSRFIPWAWVSTHDQRHGFHSRHSARNAGRIKMVLILGALSYLFGYLASKRFIKELGRCDAEEAIRMIPRQVRDACL